MATRDGEALDLVWVHVALTHNQIDAFFATVDALHRNRLATAILSVNRSVGWNAAPPTGLRQALVKVATNATAMLAALLPAARNVIIRTYTEADHHEALALVTTVEWVGTSREN